MQSIELTLDFCGVEAQCVCDYIYTPYSPAYQDEPPTHEDYEITNLCILLDIDKDNKKVPFDVTCMVEYDKDIHDAVVEVIKDEVGEY